MQKSEKGHFCHSELVEELRQIKQLEAPFDRLRVTLGYPLNVRKNHKEKDLEKQYAAGRAHLMEQVKAQASGGL